MTDQHYEKYHVRMQSCGGKETGESTVSLSLSTPTQMCTHTSVYLSTMVSVNLNKATDKNNQIKQKCTIPYIDDSWNYFNWFGEQQKIEYYFKHFLNNFSLQICFRSNIQVLKLGASRLSLHLSHYGTVIECKL